MKIELTLKADYLPNWGVAEGIRELLQNAKDAEVQYNSLMNISHKGNKLTIFNAGVSIPHEALLFGHTTKSNNDKLIGKFGEGLKLGILALVRSGYNVKIISGNEVWRPTIEKSEKFNASVLTFSIRKIQKSIDGVAVEINGINLDEWLKLRENYLFLDSLTSEQATTTPYGVLLLDPKFKGKLFVKGIFVQSDTKLSYGYDFFSADLDRDRRMISSYDLSYRTKEIWSQAVRVNTNLNKNLSDILFNSQHDLYDLAAYDASYFPKESLDFVANDFIVKFGTDAIPVENFEQSKDIEHFGKRGIVVNKSLNAILSGSKLGSYKDVHESLSNEAINFYSWTELSDHQKQVFEFSTDILTKVCGISLSEIDIVSFRSKNILGIFKGGRIQISIIVLNDVMQTIRTLIHEYAHNAGGDGDKGHIENVEKIWMEVVRELLYPNAPSEYKQNFILK